MSRHRSVTHGENYTDKIVLFKKGFWDGPPFAEIRPSAAVHPERSGFIRML